MLSQLWNNICNFKCYFFKSQKRKFNESDEISNENNSISNDNSLQIPKDVLKERFKNRFFRSGFTESNCRNHCNSHHQSIPDQITGKENRCGFVYEDTQQIVVNKSLAKRCKYDNQSVKTDSSDRDSNAGICNMDSVRAGIENIDPRTRLSTVSNNQIYGCIKTINIISINNIKTVDISKETPIDLNPKLPELSLKKKLHLLDNNLTSIICREPLHKEIRDNDHLHLSAEKLAYRYERIKQEKDQVNNYQLFDPPLSIESQVVIEKYEKKVSLPEITDDMKEKIKWMLSNKNPDYILVEEFNLSITVTDLISLKPRQWLTDNIINFYLELIFRRNNNNTSTFPKVQILTTFFYPKLKSSGYNGVKRWTKKRPIFNCDLVLVPIHLGNHWCFVLIDHHYSKVQYYDSLRTPNQECLDLMKDFLRNDSIDKSQKFDSQKWTYEQIDGPQQQNGYDCGVFLSQTAEYLSRRAKLEFTQKEMQYFRQKMSIEILNKQLL